MKKGCLVIVSILLVLNLFAQKITIPLQSLDFNAEDINRTDSLDNKHGLWVEQNDNFMQFAMYKHGIKDGISWYLERPANGIQYQFSGFANFSNGVPTSIEYVTSYDDKRNVHYVYLIDSISTISDRFVNVCHHYYICHPSKLIQGYQKEYHNGKLHSEGWLISPIEDGFILESSKVGEWIYYDESGSIINTTDETLCPIEANDSLQVVDNEALISR